MGLIGQPGKYEKICDLCLSEIEEEKLDQIEEKENNRQNPHK